MPTELSGPRIELIATNDASRRNNSNASTFFSFIIYLYRCTIIFFLLLTAYCYGVFSSYFTYPQLDIYIAEHSNFFRWINLISILIAVKICFTIVFRIISMVKWLLVVAAFLLFIPVLMRALNSFNFLPDEIQVFLTDKREPILQFRSVAYRKVYHGVMLALDYCKPDGIVIDQTYQ